MPTTSLLLEKQQNGGSTSPNLVNLQVQYFPRRPLRAPNSSLELSCQRKASTLTDTCCRHG